ncbi:hypothetical protein [Bosea minatitlanensis]|uniref:Uncharacterized protein n=1 Tax=Bosea minatitlanensis TaxID=128782 RepID=A0ABW0EZS9_9HYPH|nr:hypothetical protein [Bosea minatitlanensis]MCT4492690.1 hypothetical protein [Bosea minatitlanensis]
MGEVSSVTGGPKWNAEAQHHWPGGKYVGYTCHVCGVSGFFHHKNGPRLCYPHWQEAKRDAEWKQAKWEADMKAEYGPFTPRPDPFRWAFPTRPAKENEGHG